VTRRKCGHSILDICASLAFPKAKKLKLAIADGVDSDRVDLQAAIDRKITVAEVTYSKSISVSEHVVMLLGLQNSIRLTSG
jgi:lactate dehydrogenase-like 2-hydroxyacid dehydrogenase